MAGKLSDLMSRAKAAGKMSKKGGLPPEEEEMPISEPPMEMPPEEALAGEAPPEELPPELAGGGEEMPAPEEGPADIDMALANVEAAIEALEPQVQEEVRTHLNAIRDLVGEGGGSAEEAPPMPEGGPPADLVVPPAPKSSEVQM